MEIPSYNSLIQRSVQKHWDLDALSDYGVETFKYKDVAVIVARLHLLYDRIGIKPGDKIALCGRNMSRWGAAYVSILTYGAVAVPILNEFHPSQVYDIVNHSDARLLFVGDKVWNKLSADNMPQLEMIISLNDYSVLVARPEQNLSVFTEVDKLYAEKYPDGLKPEDIRYYQDQPDELALINYTSGTTSNSKGVMLPYRALWSNVDFAENAMGSYFTPADHVLSMLPMAHMYGLTFELMYEFIKGLHIHFLTKIASPTILMKALADVKPMVLIMVPLILEKVVRKSVFPRIQNPRMRLLMKTPIIGRIIKRRICHALTDALGGRFYQVIVGGAALNQEVEQLLKDIGFRYTIGYGATECAPIICYEDYSKLVPGSCGKPVIHMELKVMSDDPRHVPGEILARGLNVMLGYYKNPEETAKTLDAEGWYHTGDLGIMDKDGNLYIKGRSKNMLLGANGQNIYPEEIEDKLANMNLVQECVVIQKEDKLYGLVYPDYDQIKAQGLSQEALEQIMEENRKNLNASIPSYAQICGIRLMETEFEKTPKKSIKRYLYANAEV